MMREMSSGMTFSLSMDRREGHGLKTLKSSYLKHHEDNDIKTKDALVVMHKEMKHMKKALQAAYGSMMWVCTMMMKK